MFRQFLALAVAALTLCGCMLQSRSPLYSDADSKLALGKTGGTALLSSWAKGKWEPEAERVTIKVVGTHYEAETTSAPVTLNFMPLGGSWFVLQAIGGKQPAVYMLAEVKGSAADARPLACTDLKKEASLASWIDYEGEDCFIKPGAPAKDLFAALLKMPGEPSSRMEILH